MLERMRDVPAETIAFRAHGKLTGDDYRAMMIPVTEALEAGRKIDFLFVAEPDFAGLDADALWQDLKAAGSVGLRYRSSWRRFAVVTDKDWLHHWMHAFGWLSPGELRGFSLDKLDQAKAWLSEPA